MSSKETSNEWGAVADQGHDAGVVSSALTEVLSLVATLNAAFLRRKAFWAQVGKTRGRACQFILAGADNWFLEVTPTGGQARMGSHAKPDVTWRSDAGALISIFDGKKPSTRVQIDGDFSILKEIINGLR